MYTTHCVSRSAASKLGIGSDRLDLPLPNSNAVRKGFGVLKYKSFFSLVSCIDKIF